MQLKIKHKFIIISIVALFIFVINFCFTCNKQSFAEIQSVYLGGTPIGVVAKSEGVTIIELRDIISKNSVVNPGKIAGLACGDLVYKINNNLISSSEDISKIVEKTKEGDVLEIYVYRRNAPMSFKVSPIMDKATNTVKLGLNVKNELAGIGTLTFVYPSTKRFACLGHQIFDLESSNQDIYNNGNIYLANIIGYNKGKLGKTGELRGTFKKTDLAVGVIDKNTFSGIFGKAEDILYDGRPMISIGNRNSIKPGKAHIYTTINGDMPQKYEIEIVKLSPQTSPQDKSMVVRITDKKLLELTGGILQGMSGSPIVQSGHLVGAITHVFINDPSCGYGIYVDWMLSSIAK
ncbi:MAG: SpoIVB peptidase [Christensenellaceae bacterium]|nr:SpoIVB peptidase [Christensenellaceae bacterium]